MPGIDRPPDLAAGPDPTPTPAGGSRLTSAGTVMGTPLYMSPEQCEGRGDLDARSDQYALGCIFYEMLTGSVPFEGAEPHIVMIKHLHTAPKPPEVRCPEARVSPRLSALVLRMLAKDRTQRFPSLQALMHELQAEITRLLLQRGEKVLVTRSAADVFSRGRRRRLLVAASLALPLLFGSGYLLVRYTNQPAAVDQAAVQLRPGEALSARQAAVKLLTDALGDSDAERRLVAVTALGETRDPGLRARIEPLLSDAQPAVQIQAATALALLGDRAAVPALRALRTRAQLGSLRVAVAAALDQLGDEEGSQALRNTLDGGDDQARLKAALILCDRGEPRARALLTSVSKNPKLPEEVVITLLGRLAQTGEADAKAQLTSRMNTSGRRDMQLLAAAKLAQSGDEQGRAFLRASAQRRGPEQLPAARLLAGPDETAGLDVLHRTAANSQASLSERLLAIEGLGLAGRTLDVRTLLPLLTASGQDAARLREAAAAAIVQLTSGEPGTLSDRSLSWARLALDDTDLMVRESAAQVLGDEGSPQANLLLTRLARDGAPSVRRAALRSLARRGDLAAVSVLQGRVSDSDSSVRIEALRGLVSLAQLLVKKGGRELLTALVAQVKTVLEKGSSAEQILGRVLLLRLGDGSQREALRGWLTSGDGTLRRLLIENAGGDVDLLRGALNDESFELRVLAARRLAAVHDSHAIPVLREALQQGGVLSLQAYAALRQLGENVPAPAELHRAGADSAAGAGGAAAAPATVEDRLKLVDSLIDLPPADALPGLRQAARDSDPRVRQQVAEVAAALRAAGDDKVPPGVPILRLLIDDADMAVRARAAALLSRLLRSPAEQAAAAATAENPAEKLDDKAAAATGPAPPGPPPAVESNSGAGAEDSPIRQLALNGARSLTNKDFSKAVKFLEKAQKLCAKERRTSAACAEVSFDVSYHLGRAHEEQGHPAQAMVEYENAIKLASHGRSKPELLGETQEAIWRLVPRLGVVILPKRVNKTCQEVSMWMEPGRHEIQVDGQRAEVEVLAHETKKVGSCGTTAP